MSLAVASASPTRGGTPPSRLLSVREGNLEGAQTVSDSALAWRAFACMASFNASDNTPLLMLYGGTAQANTKDPLAVAANGVTSLQVFDFKSSKWYAPTTANAPKTGPVLPACGAASGNIWVYNSQYGVPNKASTAVSLLDSVHWSWSSPTQQGQLPVTRFGAASAFADSTQSFYLHGGIPLSDDTNTASKPPGIANNMDILLPSGLTWNYASNGPARKYHTLCYMSSIDSLVLFGGSDQNIASYNDVKTFSTKENIWQYSATVQGAAPAERILHSAVCTADSMYVFGGVHSIDDDPSDSAVWVLKANGPTNFTWSKAPAMSLGPTARAGHSAALHAGSMYIYGGIGPSGQDGTMYTLDLDKWKWSQTNVTGSSVEAMQKEHKTKTAVLIAAIVCSVIGVMTIGIAATVIYRFARRHHSRLFVGARRNNLGQDGESSDEDEPNGNSDKNPGGPPPPLAERNSTPSGSASCYEHGRAGMYRKDSVASTQLLPVWPVGLSHSSSIVFSPLRPEALLSSSMSDFVSGESGGGGSGGSARTPAEGHSTTTTPASVAAELLPAPKDVAVGGTGMLRTMRAHARTLSTRIGTSRLSAAFSDTASQSMAAKSSASVRQKRAATSSSSYSSRAVAHGRQQQQPPGTIIDQQTAANMYGPDFLRLESEYRHAEAINQILLSGQPIPAWLRDAVNQAQPNDGAGDDQVILPEAAPPGRKLGIANRSESKIDHAPPSSSV